MGMGENWELRGVEAVCYIVQGKRDRGFPQTNLGWDRQSDVGIGPHRLI